MNSELFCLQFPEHLVVVADCTLAYNVLCILCYYYTVCMNTLGLHSPAVIWEECSLGRRQEGQQTQVLLLTVQHQDQDYSRWVHLH